MCIYETLQDSSPYIDSRLYTTRVLFLMTKDSDLETKELDSACHLATYTSSFRHFDYVNISQTYG